MNLYDEQLTNHPVWAELTAARQPLEDAHENAADPDQVSIIARVEAVLAFTEARFNTLDAQLIHFGPIDSIAANLQQLTASLQRFNEAPGNRAFLDQAESQVSGILAYLAQLPLPTPDYGENLREIGARYRQSMSGHIGRITTEFNELKTKVEELAEQVTTQESEVSTEVARLTKAATDAEATFTEAEAARELTFQTQLKEALAAAIKAADTAAGEVRSEAEEALESLTEKADSAWEDIAGLKKRAEDASNYLGINALAAGYHETAEKEDARSFWTRVGAIASFLGAIAASAFAVGYHIANTFSLQGVLTKAILAVPVLVLAGYLARESSRHAERAHFNRQRQRQLESLPAYVDGLEPEKRAELYQALAPGFFAPVAGRAEKHGEKDSDPTGALLTLLIAELKKRTDSESA